MDPKLRFFTHDRLDLVVKHRFFKAMSQAGSMAEPEEMYARHIVARTGGVEPRGSYKTDVAMYIRAAHELFESMRRRGFDETKPISLDQWGRLRDGAHRLACATVLELEIALHYSPKRYPFPQWGIDWFLSKGFGRDYVSGLLDDVNVITRYSNPAWKQAELVRDRA